LAITQKIYSSRSNSVDSLTYVGEAGRLFYAQTTATGLAPTLRYSDGVTPGGLPLTGGSISVSGLPPTNPVQGNLWYDDEDGRLYVYYDSTWVDASPDVGYSLGVATTSTLGGIKLGTGFTALGDGTLSVNTQGSGVDQSQYYVTTSTRTLSNGANEIVSLFGVGAAVSSSTRYMFNVSFDVTNGPNNDQLLFNITGTSVLSRVTVYSYSTIGGAHQYPIYESVTSDFTTGINMNGGNNSNNGTEYTTIISGFVDVVAAGTVNPSFGFVSAGTNVVVQPNAAMKIWPISSNTLTNTIVGTWS